MPRIFRHTARPRPSSRARSLEFGDPTSGGRHLLVKRCILTVKLTTLDVARFLQLPKVGSIVSRAISFRHPFDSIASRHPPPPTSRESIFQTYSILQYYPFQSFRRLIVVRMLTTSNYHDSRFSLLAPIGVQLVPRSVDGLFNCLAIT